MNEWIIHGKEYSIYILNAIIKRIKERWMFCIKKFESFNKIENLFRDLFQKPFPKLGLKTKTFVYSSIDRIFIALQRGFSSWESHRLSPSSSELKSFPFNRPTFQCVQNKVLKQVEWKWMVNSRERLLNEIKNRDKQTHTQKTVQNLIRSSSVSSTDPTNINLWPLSLSLSLNG